MQVEKEIVRRLCQKLTFLKDKVHVQREKRIFSDFLPRKEFEQAVDYLHSEMGFDKASHVVGTDEGDELGFIYLLTNSGGIIFALKEKAPKSDPRIGSLSGRYPSLEFHERELVCLFGATIEGLPDGPSYPLPDGWPEGNYPLRKDWNPDYFDRNNLTYNPPSEEREKEGEEN